LKQWGYGEA